MKSPSLTARRIMVTHSLTSRSNVKRGARFRKPLSSDDPQAGLAASEAKPPF